MSIKSRLLELIGIANAKTGQNDSTVAGAINSLCAGYGVGSGGESEDTPVIPPPSSSGMILACDFSIDDDFNSTSKTKVASASTNDFGLIVRDKIYICVFKYLGTAGSGEFSKAIGTFSTSKTLSVLVPKGIITYNSDSLNIKSQHTDYNLSAEMTSGGTINFYMRYNASVTGLFKAGTYRMEIYESPLN